MDTATAKTRSSDLTDEQLYAVRIDGKVQVRGVGISLDEATHWCHHYNSTLPIPAIGRGATYHPISWAIVE